MKRREALIAGLGVLATGSLPRLVQCAAATTDLRQQQRLAAIERRSHGRLGVAMCDLGSGKRIAYRADERFPMCSTHKWLLVAYVLSRVDAGQEDLSRFVPYDSGALLDYAPVTRENLRRGGMSVSELCEAAVEYSDNTAANLLLDTVSGPAGVTSYLRAIGDHVTRLDRIEPELNSAVPGDPRDTTTPSSMLGDMDHLLLGRGLAESSRNLLLGWLIANTTGGAKLRAGTPGSWRVGDKTGMGANGATGDVAIAWPTNGEPVLIAAYLTETNASTADRNGALEAVGGVAGDWLGT